MNLLPNITDLHSTIERLVGNKDIFILISSHQSDRVQKYNADDTLRWLKLYTMAIVSVSEAYIVVRNANMSLFTLTFHKQTITQIGIEAL